MSRRWERWGAAAVLVVGLWLLWRATAEQSFTLDEPYHLVAGLQMHQHGTNTVNLDHPPLVKWVAAWPLAGEPALAAPPLRIAEVQPAWMALFAEPETTRRYLLASRGMVVLVFVLPLLTLIFIWGRRFGPRAGFALIALFLMAPITLPYLPLVMTDTAATLGFVAVVLAATLFAERPTAGRALGLGLAAGLAAAAKFSGLMAAPAVLGAFVFAAGKTPWRRWVGLAAVVAGASFALLLATYALANPLGDSRLAELTAEDYLAGAGNPEVGVLLEGKASFLRAVTSRSVELGQYLTGLFWLAARDHVGVFASVAFSQLSSDGRWWYFPALLLIQTPLSLLGAGVLAASSAWKEVREAWRDRLRDPRWALPAVVTAVYLVVACTSRYNLGLRHLLPIMPFLLLPIAVWASRDLRRLVVVLGILLVESTAMAPLWMSSTNTWWLGQDNPTRRTFSAFEYKQNLIALAEEARSRGLEPLKVFYPLMSDRELHAYFPEAEIDDYSKPLEPGLYAVNIQAEILLPAIYRTGPRSFTLYSNYRSAGRPWFRRLQEIQARGKDQGFVAGTFHLYLLGPDPSHSPPALEP